MPFSAPTLTRQNAFYIVDDNKSRSPLDPTCEICFLNIDNSDELVRPCKCQAHNRPALFAHEECFIQWLKENKYPRKCSKCKSKYTLVLARPIPVMKIIGLSVIIVIMCYFFIHLRQCTEIKVMTKDQIQALSGESAFKNIPEQLVFPRISKSCICNRYHSLSNHFISILHLLFISFIATLCSFILVHFV